MFSATHAYAQGVSDAKVAFLGKLYDKYIKGDLGPFLSTLGSGSPAMAGIAGAAGQAIDTPPEGSKILRSLGVGGGAAIANSLVHPVAQIVAATAVASLGLNPASGWTTLLRETISDIPTGIAQSFAAKKGRGAAEHVEKFLKEKGTRIP